VEHKIVDPEGCNFWKHYYVSEVAPAWQEFWTCLITYLKVPRASIPSEADPRLAVFKQILADPKNINDPDPPVTIENFNNFLIYFGPLNIEMIDRMMYTVSGAWFHGDITLKKAEGLLLKKKKDWCIFDALRSKTRRFYYICNDFEER